METCSTAISKPADVSVSTRISAGPPIALSVAAPSGVIGVLGAAPEAVTEYLTAAGHAPYAQGQRYGADGDGYSIYLTDPEGTVVELKSGH